VAFTAVTGVEQAAQWRQRGFAGCIAKPASLAQLEAGLREARPPVAAAATVAQAVASEAAAGAADCAADHAADCTIDCTADCPAEAPAPPDEPLDALDHARYMAMLKEHLRSDLPRLAALIAGHDCNGLRDWAHSAGGAFLIVREPHFAGQCRELQRLCDATGVWSEAIAQFALALHDAMRSRFGLDEATLH
jgi:two-component system, NarL family, capsular synthesis sensor histidine kinase RcsC